MGAISGMHTSRLQQKGFTIVELLIVVVVIAILAAITIVSYNGIKDRADRAAMQSNTEQLTKQVLTYKALNGALPPSLSALNEGQGPKLGETVLYAYTLSGDQFCLTVGKKNVSYTYYIAHEGAAIAEGACTGHAAILAGGFPSRDGFTNITYLSGGGDLMRAPIGSIPVGSWMMVVLAYTNVADPVPPAGWTTLAPRHNVGSLEVSLYGKIKQSGDSNDQLFDAAGTTGATTSTGVLLWGSNAAAVANWTVGSYGDRAVNATATTVVTPTVSVPTAKSLVLSIAAERTTIDEADYTSMTGATPWIWIPQAGDTNKLQTIAIGYNEQAATGTSQAMTVTYPNTQVNNGTGIQIAIPPAP